MFDTQFPGETDPAPRNLAYYVSRIGDRWYKTTETVLDVAQLCAEAMKTLPPSDRQNLKTKIGFNKGTLSKLAAIGRDTRLLTEEAKSRLPHNYTILYEISKLTNVQFEAAVAEGIICPDMHRADLDAWLPKPKGEPKPVLFAVIEVLEDMSEAEAKELKARLREVAMAIPKIRVQGKMEKWALAFKRIESDLPLAA